MKRACCLLMLASLCLCGCAAQRHVRAALKDANLDLSIESVHASGVWSGIVPGHGLGISVWVIRDPGDYERNLKLELECAAKVCAALASSDYVVRWAYIDVDILNWYRPVGGTRMNLAGTARVIVRRETLIMLRDRNAPASEYPRYWKFVCGHKDQPDSKEPLLW